MNLDKKNKKGIHYAWLILISCCVLYGTTTGMLINCQGIFHTAIYQDFGWKYSDYCKSTIFMGLCASAMLPFTDWFLKKVNIKLLLSVCVVIYAGAFCLRGSVNSITGFCLVYGIAGIAGAFLLYVSIPVLLNNWFVKSKSLALSIAMMSAGITGSFMNPIMSSLIQKYGWRVAARLNGIFVILLALPFIIIFVAKTPEEMGMKPYGADEKSEINSKGTDNKKKELTGSETTILVASCFVVALLINFAANSPQQLANYASSRSFSQSTGAFMVSMAMFGNIGSKLLIGLVVDKLGEIKTFTTIIVVLIIGFIMLMLNPQEGIALYIASLITGFSCGLNVLLPPMAIASFSDNENYPKNLSKANTGSMIMTAFSMFIGGWLFDLSGNYNIYLAACIIAGSICLFLSLMIFKKAKK